MNRKEIIEEDKKLIGVMKRLVEMKRLGLEGSKEVSEEYFNAICKSIEEIGKELAETPYRD